MHVLRHINSSWQMWTFDGSFSGCCTRGSSIGVNVWKIHHAPAEILWPSLSLLTLLLRIYMDPTSYFFPGLPQLIFFPEQNKKERKKNKLTCPFGTFCSVLTVFFSGSVASKEQRWSWHCIITTLKPRQQQQFPLSVCACARRQMSDILWGRGH